MQHDAGFVSLAFERDYSEGEGSDSVKNRYLWPVCLVLAVNQWLTDWWVIWGASSEKITMCSSSENPSDTEIRTACDFIETYRKKFSCSLLVTITFIYSSKNKSILHGNDLILSAGSHKYSLICATCFFCRKVNNSRILKIANPQNIQRSLITAWTHRVVRLPISLFF